MMTRPEDMPVGALVLTLGGVGGRLLVGDAQGLGEAAHSRRNDYSGCRDLCRNSEHLDLGRGGAGRRNGGPQGGASEGVPAEDIDC